MEKIAWKAANSVLVMFKHNMKPKVFYDTMLRHSLEMRTRIQSIACKFFIAPYS